MSIEDMPQVQNVPEPVAQMQKVDVAQFKNLDDLINGILDEIGNKGSALAIATAGAATNVVARGVDRIASATAAYDPNFIAAGSTSLGRGNSQDGPSQGRGRDVADSQSVGSQRSEEVSVPARGQQVAMISAATNVSEHDYGYLTPNVSFGKGPAQSQGYSVA